MQEADGTVLERHTSESRSTHGLSARQSSILRFIERFTSDHGFPPTVAELSESIGIAGSSVHHQIANLIRKGYVRRDDGKARGLVVVDERVEPAFSLVAIPLLSQAPDQQQVIAEVSTAGEIAVDSRVIGGGAHFALTVDGDDMRNADIEHGDIVIVRRQSAAESGDIVVALLGSESAIRRLYIRGERMELRTDDSAHAPVPIGPDSDMRIVGKVVGVGRRSPR